MIASSAFTCINLGGVDSAARPFTRALSVSKGHVQAIWCGVQVPEAAHAGDYAGAATVSAQGTAAVSVPLTLRVSPSVIPAHGDDEPWRLSRLRWLDSTMAVDDELVKPYTPVTVSGRTVGVLGRTVTLNALGFPEQIESRFAIEMTHLADQAARGADRSGGAGRAERRCGRHGLEGRRRHVHEAGARRGRVDGDERRPDR